MKYVAPVAWGIFTSLFTHPVYAVYDDPNGGGSVATFGDIQGMLERTIQAVGSVAGVILLIALVIGGFSFMFAGGDAKAMEKAKNTITYAFIGLLVIAGAYLIISTIGTLTGTSNTLLDLSVPGVSEE